MEKDKTKKEKKDQFTEEELEKITKRFIKKMINEITGVLTEKETNNKKC